MTRTVLQFAVVKAEMLVGVGVQGVKGAPVIRQRRPAVGCPVNPVQAHRGRAVVVAVVIMIGEPVGAVVVHDGGMAGADVPRGAFQHHQAAAVGHVDPVLVEVGSGDGRTPAHADVIRTVHAGAAAAEIDEQVVVAAALVKTRTLLGVAVIRRSTAGDLGAQGSRVQTFAGGWINLRHHDAVRVGAVRHPDRAARVHENAGINAVVGEGVGVGGEWIMGLDHFALIRPNRRSQ